VPLVPPSAVLFSHALTIRFASRGKLLWLLPIQCP
jgi:hypothetical protein